MYFPTDLQHNTNIKCAKYKKTYYKKQWFVRMQS